VQFKVFLQLGTILVFLVEILDFFGFFQKVREFLQVFIGFFNHRPVLSLPALSFVEVSKDYTDPPPSLRDYGGQVSPI
jgi:hypothetical protein